VRTDYELFVLVNIQTVIPGRSLRALCDVYPDVHELARIIGIAITAAVESRLAQKGGDL
jgi:hypothetical protein